MARLDERQPDHRRSRRAILALIQAPAADIDLGRLPWDGGPAPIRVCTLERTPHLVRRLVLVAAGAEIPTHVHEHDEYVLILRGAIEMDGDAIYYPGNVLFSPRGSIHSGRALPDESCLCYLVILP